MAKHANEQDVESEHGVPARRRPVARYVTALIAVGCAALFLQLLGTHTIGGETEGVVVAAIGVATAVLSFAFLAVPRRRALARAALLLLWLVLIGGGIGGYIDHSHVPAPGQVVKDPRPRPPFAPLVFSALGVAGAAALVAGSRNAQSASRGHAGPDAPAWQRAGADVEGDPTR